MSQENNTKIIVALITVFGGLATAVIANWDNIFNIPDNPDIVEEEVYKSCNEIKNNTDSKTDGIYEIDPDGENFGVQPSNVYCLMTVEGGGWTLIANHADGFNPEKKDSISTSMYGVASDEIWTSLRNGMNDGMMFIDENGRVSKISKIKLDSANCKNINSITSLQMNRLGAGAKQTLIHAEFNGCYDGGQDYTLINLAGNEYNNYQIAGAALYQQSNLKFDIWPYSEDFSYKQQNKLQYYIR